MKNSSKTFTLLITTGISVLILLGQGCSSQKEAVELRESGPLYPVAKLGDGIHAMATPFSLSDSNLPHVKYKLTAEEKAELEKIALFYDKSYSLNGSSETAYGMGIGAYAFPSPTRDLLILVEQTAGMQFDWYINPALGDAAISLPGGAIVFNPGVLAGLPYTSQLFVLLHESGHQVHGDVSQGGMILGMTQPWLRPEMELNADAFAAQKMSSLGYSPQTIVYAAFCIFGPSPGDATHPPGYVRIQNVKTTLGIQ